MARPREFDEDEVLDRALELFFRKGYEATSVQDLVDATGLARASLYGAFGDKQALFARLLDRYLSRAPSVDGLLDPALPAREALGRLLRSWVEVTCPEQGPRGCFLQLAAAQQDATPCAQPLMQASNERMGALLERFLSEAQQRGELDPGRSPRVLSELLLVLQQGIAAAARGGQEPQRLQEAVDELLDLIFTGPRESTASSS